MHSMITRAVRRVFNSKYCVGSNCVKDWHLHYKNGKIRQLFLVNRIPVYLYSSNSSSLGFIPNSDKFKKSQHICRSLSTAIEPNENKFPSGRLKEKKFVELENEVFHAYLENSPNYCETVHKSDTKLTEFDVSQEEFSNIVKKGSWAKETADDYFLSFVKIACYCSKNVKSISDPIFANLCDAFYSHCVNFSDDQLIRCFVCLQNWLELPGVRDENFLKIWKGLDGVCVMRRKDLDLKTTLYFMDLWYCLKLSRLSEFVMKSIWKFVEKPKRLGPHGLVQFMFYLNTVRKVSKGQSTFELEFQLSEVLQSLTIEEIGIVCAGFFKSQNKVTSAKFIDDIILMLIEHRENVDPVTLASIFKFIRYSQKLDNIETIKKMFDAFLPVINNYSFQVVIHFSLVCEQLNISHPQMIDNLIKRFMSAPGDARLKDMAIIAKLVTTFGNESDEVCQLIISEIESDNRLGEVNEYSKAAIQCLSYLSYKKYFSGKFIPELLNDAYLIDLYGNKYSVSREVIVLDQNITLEFPEYKGSKLSTPFANYLCQKHSKFIPGMFQAKRGSSSDRLLRDLMISVRSLSGDRDCLWHCTYFLPHFPKADVLIHLDENDQLQGIPSEIKTRKYFTGYIKPPNTTGHWLIFVIGTKVDYTSDDKPIGEHLCKIRQLRLLGYTPVEIPYFEFMVMDTPEKKLDYIKNKVMNYKSAGV